MPSESGDMKLIGNFSQLSEIVTTHPGYNPVNTALKAPALNAQKAAALAAAQNIGALEALYKAAVNERQDGFERVPSIISRAGNMFKVSGASSKSQDDLKTVQRKITGRRKGKKIKDDPNTPQNEASATHSVSQLSYDNIVGHLDDFIAMLATVPGYAPNEADLTIAGLTALSTELKAKNDAVNEAFAPVSAARGRRDQLVYLNEDCIVNIALLIKAYVRAAFGSDSQIFKSIKGLEFHRQGRKARR